jgi:23S rRNA (cytosine1962-C5)-methyltransferase
MIADVFQILRKFARQERRFDLVIIDPPTYSSSGWKSGAQWRDLVQGVLRVVDRGGAVLASTNDGRLSLGQLRKHIRDAARLEGRDVVKMKDLPLPPDFPLGFGQPVSKSIWVTLD